MKYKIGDEWDGDHARDGDGVNQTGRAGYTMSSKEHLEDLKQELLLRQLKKKAGAGAARASASPENPEVSLLSAEVPPDGRQITAELLAQLGLEAAQFEHIARQVPGGAANIQDIYPLAPLQAGLLFHHLFSEAGDAYILPVLLRLDSAQLLPHFLATLKAVVQRHDALRTAIFWQGLASPVQVVCRQVTLPVESMTCRASAAQHEVLEQIRQRMAPQNLRMNLQEAPLLRVSVFEEAHGAGCYVLLQFHHIISDHVSLEIALNEALHCLAGHADRLPPPVPYRDFVLRSLERHHQEEAAAYFRARLADIDEPTAPFGLLDVHGDGSRIHEAHLPVAPHLAQELRRCATQWRVSVAALFHAAMALLLARLCGRDDVVFGSVLFGRLQGQPGIERVVGLFINTLPLRLSLQGSSVRQLLQQTQLELLGLLRHEQASLAQVQRCSALPADVPLFTAVLNYRHSAVTEHLQHPGVEVLASQERTNYPITLSVDDLGTGFTLVAQTDSRISPQRLVAYLHTALQQLLQTLDVAPESPVLTLSIIHEKERREVIEHHNATAMEFPRDALMHSLFEKRVAEHPERIAVVFADQSLDYGTLNARANQLARALRARGVGPDVRVALCVERSIDMLIGLLGVLKAGGAYVPIDPAYTERIAHMFDDARPRVILTQTPLYPLLEPHVSGLPLIALDRFDAEIAEHATDPLTPPKSPSAGASGLCHLHFGLHGFAQGGDARTSRGGQLPAFHAARARHDCR